MVKLLFFSLWAVWVLVMGATWKIVALRFRGQLFVF